MPSITAPVAAAGIIGAGSIASGVIGSSGAQSAANTQANAEDQAAQLQAQTAATNVTNLTPFRNTGQSANYSLADLYGLDSSGGTAGTGTVGTGNIAGGALQQLMALNGLGPNGQASGTAIPSALQQFVNSPTYQWAQQQGMAGLNASAASKGTLLSGAQSMAAQQYGQGLASQQLGTYTTNLQNLYSGLVSGLGGLASQGENAAATAGNQGVQSAGQIGQSLVGAGTAAASGILGSTNATTGGISNSLAALTGSNSSYGGSNSLLGALLNSGSSPLGSASPIDSSGNATSTGGQTLQSLGFYNPLPTG